MQLKVQLHELVLRRGGGGGLDDFVGQVVTEWRGNGQGLHLLGGHHAAKGHPAHVLQTGYATRTLPEVHTTIPSPSGEKKSSSSSSSGASHKTALLHYG